MRSLSMLAGLILLLRATNDAAPFAFVMIDSATEAKYGSVPLDRKLLAEAVVKIRAAGAKGIVLKFFFDLPSNEASDRALEESVCGGKVALQACLNSTEGSTNALPPKFSIEGAAPKAVLAGDSGFIPLPRLLRCAEGVGFVDFDDPAKAPLLESYQGKPVKSLYLVALEMAVGEKARMAGMNEIILGGRRLRIDDTGSRNLQLPSASSFSYAPFHEVLGNAADQWKPIVKDAVVVIGYDGEKIHKIQTPGGALGAHRYFGLCLLGLARELR